MFVPAIYVILSYSILIFFNRRQEKTVMKIVVDAQTDKVLGASMCGPDAPEIVQVLLLLHILC